MSPTQGLWALRHSCLFDKCYFSLLPDESLNEIHLDISSDRKNTWCWHKKHDWGGSKSEEEGVSSNARLVLKRVEHFSRPATFQSIKIDLFVMKGDPFRILRACNLCEMGVSLTKTGRQRLKNDRGKEESGSGRDWGEKENRPIVLIRPLFWLSEMNFCSLLCLLSLIPWAGSSTLGLPQQIREATQSCYMLYLYVNTGWWREGCVAVVQQCVRSKYTKAQLQNKASTCSRRKIWPVGQRWAPCWLILAQNWRCGWRNIYPVCCQATAAFVVMVSLKKILSDENAACDKMSQTMQRIKCLFLQKKKGERHEQVLTEPQVKHS